MILPLAFLIGAGLGWYRAAKRGGTTLDKLQYGAAHGFALFLLTLTVTILLDIIGFY